MLARPRGDAWRLEHLGEHVLRHAADVTDRASIEELVERVAPEWLFHLASFGNYSWQVDASRIAAVCVVGTVNLLEAARAAGVRAFVHAGSSSEYGFKDHPPAESEAVRPTTAYGAAKAGATLQCAAAARAQDAHIVTLRLYSAYGPWEDPRRLFPTLIRHGLSRALPPLVDPNTARDFVHVDDVSRAFTLAAEYEDLPRGSVYNVGSGRQTTLADIVSLARQHFGITAAPRWGTEPPRVWDTACWVSDPSAIEQALGWRASISLDRGLEQMVRWLRDQPVAVRSERYEC